MLEQGIKDSFTPIQQGTLFRPVGNQDIWNCVLKIEYNPVSKQPVMDTLKLDPVTHEFLGVISGTLDAGDIGEVIGQLEPAEVEKKFRDIMMAIDGKEPKTIEEIREASKKAPWVLYVGKK